MVSISRILRKVLIALLGLPQVMKEKLQELLEIQIAGVMKKTDKK
jgi:hypothetical protein